LSDLAASLDNVSCAPALWLGGGYSLGTVATN